MTTLSRSAHVPYTSEQMFVLVSDIRAYPSFLPWCSEAHVLSETDDEIRATIRLAKRGIETSFTTCNRLQKHESIEMRLENGPFKRMQGFWRFEAVNERNSSVSLDMDFELSNRLLKMTIGPVFNQIANSLVDAFVKRAHEVYG